MNTEATPKYWEKTRHNNLVRHKISRRYYARLYRNGKEKWKSLKTTHYSVAESKLAELQKEHREHPETELDSGNAKMTFSQAAEIHLRQVDQDVATKKTTKMYAREVLASLLESWPELAAKEIRRISAAGCQEWAAGYAKEYSATRYNGTVSLLRHVFDVAVKGSIIYSNPATEIKRKRAKRKTLELPSLGKFAEFITEMRRGHGRHSKHCADLTEGLAYTGMRIGEAAEVVRGDVDLVKGTLRVAGDPEDATKNGEVRHVRLNPQARQLFLRMLEARPDEERNAKLFLVHECQKAINRAARNVDMTRITHHDLRHFFATICIESGVDIPTVSRWLGHKDGGALAMQTYGHLRDEHSSAQAERVSFVPRASALAA